MLNKLDAARKSLRGWKGHSLGNANLQEGEEL